MAPTPYIPLEMAGRLLPHFEYGTYNSGWAILLSPLEGSLILISAIYHAC